MCVLSSTCITYPNGAPFLFRAVKVTTIQILILCRISYSNTHGDVSLKTFTVTQSYHLYYDQVISVFNRKNDNFQF